MKTATELAQQIADQELEACLEWAKRYDIEQWSYSESLRAARRPKSPSLKEQALADLDKIESSDRGGYAVADLTAIRRALEAIND